MTRALALSVGLPDRSLRHLPLAAAAPSRRQVVSRDQDIVVVSGAAVPQWIIAYQ